MTLPDTIRRLPMDDLSSVAELVGDAHLVAIGENNHHIREFGLLRDRILRFLVTELGFGVLAFESGFAEGQLVDDWIRGGAGDLETIAREGFTFRFGEATEVRDMLGWLRAHNADGGGGRVRYAGVDVPSSGGSVVPGLALVRDYLEKYAPTEVSYVDDAVTATEPYVAANNAVASGRYAELSTASRDAAAAALSRLALRLDALEPGSDPYDHKIARHHALGALRLDEQLREFVALGQPNPPALVASSRDIYQAATVRLLREVFGPDERIVLMVHNGHAQRVPDGTDARGANTYCRQLSRRRFRY
ncbi:erythromycin esterase family protein [Fodinicola feengrottensis]|uniref:erythromycin esterase family protein n=1 Tax=Fodinicola feengrottensis TaxID=435914 RepID=UPI002441839D|nr:erythromycin esterase family protein [Fodinicola feengrottensis]